MLCHHSLLYLYVTFLFIYLFIYKLRRKEVSYILGSCAEGFPVGYIRIDRLNALDLVPADGPYLDLLHTLITLTRKFNIIYQKLNMKLKKKYNGFKWLYSLDESVVCWGNSLSFLWSWTLTHRYHIYQNHFLLYFHLVGNFHLFNLSI